MAIRRRDVTDIAWVFVRLEMKYLITHQRDTMLTMSPSNYSFVFWQATNKIRDLSTKVPWYYPCHSLGGAIF